MAAALDQAVPASPKLLVHHVPACLLRPVLVPLHSRRLRRLPDIPVRVQPVPTARQRRSPLVWKRGYALWMKSTKSGPVQEH